MLINEKAIRKPAHVKFISYDGKFPNLCGGMLTLEIDDVVCKFHSYKRIENETIYPSFWCSGGSINADYSANREEWRIDVDRIPEQFRKYAREIDEAFNRNVPFGCCGGCA